MKISTFLTNATVAAFLAIPAQGATYWNVFNIEGETDNEADIVYYDTFEDMLEDKNRAGTGQLSNGAPFTRNVVDSGSDGVRFWNVFNIEGETDNEADIVWYNTFADMLEDENRAGTGQLSNGAPFTRNVVGSGSDGVNYWNVFNIEGETDNEADIVWYNTFEDMLEDENRAGTGQLSNGAPFTRNVVGSGSDGVNYWNVFNIEGETDSEADIVYYDTFADMLEDENRAGTGHLLNGAPFTRNVVGSGATIFTMDPNMSPIPVPASLPLLFGSILGLGLIRRRAAT